MLFLVLVDAANPVNGALGRLQYRREERALAGEDPRHIGAEGFHKRDDERGIDRDLNPAVGGHVSSSEPLGADERVNEIDKDEKHGECAEGVVDDHVRLYNLSQTKT